MSTSTKDPEELRKQIRKIMGLLSNKDAMEIFASASEGLVSGEGAPHKLGMTPRRYYKRLSHLLAAGLLTKSGKLYRHSGLGELVYRNEVLGLQAILTRKHGLELLDDLRRGTRISETDLEKITSVVLDDMESALNLSNLRPIGVLKSYEDLVAEAQKQIERASKEVDIATRYSDFRVVQSTLRKAKEGVIIRGLLSERGGLPPKFQMLGIMLSHPETVKLWQELRNKSNCIVRQCKLPYSFCVVDGVMCGIEIVNPVEPEDFFLGLEFESEALGKKLTQNFNKLWERATEDPLQKLLRKPLESVLKSLSQYPVNNRAEA